MSPAARMRGDIAKFLSYCLRNKIIFIPKLISCLYSVDVGFELAMRLKDKLAYPNLSLIDGQLVNSNLAGVDLTNVRITLN